MSGAKYFNNSFIQSFELQRLAAEEDLHDGHHLDGPQENESAPLLLFYQIPYINHILSYATVSVNEQYLTFEQNDTNKASQYTYEWQYPICQKYCWLSPNCSLVMLTIGGFILLGFIYIVCTYVIEW